MIFDFLFKKETTKEPKSYERRAYLIINNYPFPLKQEMVEDLLEIGAPVVWMNEKGEIRLEQDNLYG